MTLIGRVRGLGKWAFDRIRNEKFKHNLLQAIPFWVASLLTGLVAVLYTRLFALAEKGTAYIVHWHFWLLFLITPGYIGPLFTTSTGQMVAFGAACSMGLGIFIMNKIATIKV